MKTSKRNVIIGVSAVTVALAIYQFGLLDAVNRVGWAVYWTFEAFAVLMFVAFLSNMGRLVWVMFLAAVDWLPVGLAALQFGVVKMVSCVLPKTWTAESLQRSRDYLECRVELFRDIQQQMSYGFEIDKRR